MKTIRQAMMVLLATFSMAMNSYAQVSIITPAGTEERKFGETIDISWTNGEVGSSDYFSFYYSKDGESYVNFTNLYIYQLTNEGTESTYTWTIPDFGNDSASEVTVRVLNNTSATADTSEAFRVYYEPSVTITSPLEIDQRKFGETMDITWTNGDVGSSDYFSLYYSKDGESYVNFTNLYIYQLVNDGAQSTYTWTIPDFGNDSASEVTLRVLNNTRAVADTSEAFRVFYEPSVTITSPLEIDQRKFGETMDITWTNGDVGSSDYFSLYYSKDGESYVNFTNLYIYQLVNDGAQSTYAWTIPDFGNDSASEVTLRVLNNTRAVADTSEAFRVYYEPSVTITSPLELDQRKFGETMDIKWINGDAGSSDYFSLYYSKDGGNYVNFTNLYIYQLVNDGAQSTYTWTVPDFGNDSASEVTLRVLNNTRAVADTSEAFRVYYEPSVAISSPAPGEFVSQGSSKVITWTNGDVGSSDYFQFYYSIDGASYVNFANQYIYQFSTEGNTSSMTWAVPQVESTNVKIRVLNSTRAVSDTTLSFTICATCPEVAVYSPNGGEELAVGSTIDIGWSIGEAWESTDNVLIELSLDGGDTFEASPVFEGAYSEVSENKFAWQVPNTETTSAIVRISNVTKGISDVSDGVFTIVFRLTAPGMFFTTENEDATVTLSWSDDADNETGYRVEYSTNNEEWTSYSTDLEAGTVSYTTQAIATDTAFWWRVVVLSDQQMETSKPRFAGTIDSPGNALHVDGTDDHVLIEAPALLSGSQRLTMETWAKFEEVGNYGVVAVKGTTGTSRVDLQFAADGRILGVVANGSTSYGQTATSLVPGEWYHLAMVFDGTQQANADKLKIYINGVQETLTFTGSLPATTAQSTAPLRIGTYYDGTFQSQAEYDELRIWSVVRSSQQLSEAMFATLSGSENGLEAYYRFDQSGAVTFLPDYSTNNYVGEWLGTSGANTAPNWIESGALMDFSLGINLTLPNGGESIVAGSEYEITWETYNIAVEDLIEIRLSTDGGETYSIIADGTFGMYEGSYLWTVPEGLTTTARIQIANTTSEVSDASDANFSIIESPVGITLISPNGGEFWEIGTQEVVSWEPVDFVGTDLLEIRLSVDGGETFTVLSEGESSTYTNNQYALEVPESATEAAIISVVNVTQGVSDASDEPFIIGTIDRTITVISPNGGETWQGASVQAISWETTNIDAGDLIEIRLSTDGGETFTIINDGTFGTYPENNLSWTVSDTPGESAIISVVNTSRGISDQSDAVFTITKAPDVVAPNFITADAGSIVGESFDMQVALDEEATVYLVALSDGSSLPNATQIRDAATGESSLEGQAAIGVYEYTTPGEGFTLLGDGDFIRNQLYDFYLTAVDETGNLNPGLGRPNVLAQLTAYESDSVTVDQIYAEMGGENWTNVADDWIELPIAEREEITLSENRIVGIDLSGKSLAGSLPASVTGLTALEALNLSNNAIEGLPNMSQITALASLQVAENRLDFGDLEPNSTLFDEPENYSPQAQIGERDSVAIAKGTEYTLGYNVSGINNTYKWLVDKYNTYPVDFTNVAQATANSYTVSNIDFDNMGTYTLEVENPLLPGLTLSSAPVQVWATATLEITIFGENDALLTEGAAYALRNRGSGLPYDSIPKDANGISDPDGLAVVDGKAVFENLLLGSYLVGIRADREKYLPTYFKRTYLWEEADTLDFKDNLKDTMEMYVIPPPLGPDDGEGVVAGVIESEFDEDDESGRIESRRKVKRAGCSMRRFVSTGRETQDNADWELIAYVESDDEGRFQFDFIPPGTYRFNIEYPGIPMDPNSFVQFEVGEDGSNSSIELQAVITEDGIFVERINTLGFTRLQLDELSVYPNPASDRLYLKHSDMYEGYTVRLVDLAGNVIHQSQIRANEGVIELDTYRLKKGMYFLNILDPQDQSKRITYKIMINH